MTGGDRAPVAVVTGAGGGIGAAVVRRMVAAGYRVTAVDVVFGADADPDAAWLTLDITDDDAVDSAAAGFADATIDALVNCAAVRPTGSILQTTPQQWRACIDVNLTGPFLMCRAFLPKLANPASVVNVCSAAAHGRKDLAAYGASKAALLSLTRSMALDHAPHGIRVNAILPGTTATPMVESIMGLTAGAVTIRPSPRTTTGLVLPADDVARGIVEVVTGSGLTTGAAIPIGLLPYEW